MLLLLLACKIQVTVEDTDPVDTDVEVQLPPCENGVVDGDESDVDCGGTCDVCADGRACGDPADCASGICEDGTCVAEPLGTPGRPAQDCTQLLAKGNGRYWLDVGGVAYEVECDQVTDGGGWIVIAHAWDEVYETAPPAIGLAGTWEDWTRYDWRSGDSYYLPLTAFDALTDATTELMQVSRDDTGATVSALVYTAFDYDVVTNLSVPTGCTDLVGTPCANNGAWHYNPPKFSGWGRGDYCNTAYPDQIWGYHNEMGCASDSGLFRWDGSTTPRPQWLGLYNKPSHEALILVR